MEKEPHTKGHSLLKVIGTKAAQAETDVRKSVPFSEEQKLV